jgi:hypothetical protein
MMNYRGIDSSDDLEELAERVAEGEVEDEKEEEEEEGKEKEDVFIKRFRKISSNHQPFLRKAELRAHKASSKALSFLADEIELGNSPSNSSPKQEHEQIELNDEQKQEAKSKTKTKNKEHEIEIIKRKMSALQIEKILEEQSLCEDD